MEPRRRGRRPLRASNNRDLVTIETNMFRRYRPGEVSAITVDARSIVMHPIPRSRTLNGFSAGFNRELSETDEEFIRTKYPRERGRPGRRGMNDADCAIVVGVARYPALGEGGWPLELRGR